MSTFTLDTSGAVALPIEFGYKTYNFVWDHLSPFAQGYVEALLRSMEPQPGQWFRMPSGSVHVGATFLRFGTVNGGECKAWAIVQLDQGGKRCAGPTRHELASKLTPRFSDLSPEALAMILRDCEERVKGWKVANSAVWQGDKEEGGLFWRDRQQALCADFPPLRVSLDDAGKVRLSALTSSEVE